MVTFVKLTTPDGNEIIVNLERVLTINSLEGPTVGSRKLGPVTQLTFSLTKNDSIWVKETPAQIRKQIGDNGGGSVWKS